MITPGWADLYDWKVDRTASVPIFQQIYQQIRTAILSRHLSPETRLPSTRELASRLLVARASVVSAYEQLLAEGYVFGKTGSGTFISSDLPEPIERGPLRRTVPPIVGRRSLSAKTGQDDLVAAMARTDEKPFDPGRMSVDARTAETWRKLTNRVLRTFASTHMGYSDPCGLVELRTAICEYLTAARAVRCDPDQVVVTAGTQQGLDIAIRTLLRPGDEVWVEDPGYPLTTCALAAASLRPRFVPVDGNGIDVVRGFKSAPRAKAAVVTPSLQYPTGGVLSMARRLELIAWARETGAWILEDDYASEFRYAGRPLASLQGLDETGRVIYFGTLNKTLFPGLRMGYAVVPHAILRRFINLRLLTDRQAPSITQAVLTEFMREGHLASHIRRTRALYRDQRDTLAEELQRKASGAVMLDLPEQGMHINAYLRDGMSDIEIEKAARRAGLSVRALSRLYRTAPPKQAIMLGFAGYPRRLIIPAAARLAQVIMQHSRRARRSA